MNKEMKQPTPAYEDVGTADFTIKANQFLF